MIIFKFPSFYRKLEKSYNFYEHLNVKKKLNYIFMNKLLAVEGSAVRILLEKIANTQVQKPFLILVSYLFSHRD